VRSRVGRIVKRTRADTASLDGQDRVAQRHAADPRARRTDYLTGTVTGPGTLENTAMKSRSSGVR
jgi:hypothetical protein